MVCKTQNSLRTIFKSWANLVYDQPLLVLAGCAVFVAGCCVGLIFFRITYDPVELWTTPTSQSRINKVT